MIQNTICALSWIWITFLTVSRNNTKNNTFRFGIKKKSHWLDITFLWNYILSVIKVHRFSLTIFGNDREYKNLKFVMKRDLFSLNALCVSLWKEMIFHVMSWKRTDIRENFHSPPTHTIKKTLISVNVFEEFLVSLR